MKGYWKVPFRAVYCDTFAGMLKSTLWCFVVIKVFPNVIDMDYAPLNRQDFLTQYEFMFRRAQWARVLRDPSTGPVEKIRAQAALEHVGTPACTPDWMPLDNSDLNKLLAEAGRGPA